MNTKVLYSFVQLVFFLDNEGFTLKNVHERALTFCISVFRLFVDNFSAAGNATTFPSPADSEQQVTFVSPAGGGRGSHSSQSARRGIGSTVGSVACANLLRPHVSLCLSYTSLYWWKFFFLI